MAFRYYNNRELIDNKTLEKCQHLKRTSTCNRQIFPHLQNHSLQATGLVIRVICAGFFNLVVECMLFLFYLSFAYANVKREVKGGCSELWLHCKLMNIDRKYQCKVVLEVYHRYCGR